MTSPQRIIKEDIFHPKDDYHSESTLHNVAHTIDDSYNVVKQKFFSTKHQFESKIDQTNVPELCEISWQQLQDLPIYTKEAIRSRSHSNPSLHETHTQSTNKQPASTSVDDHHVPMTDFAKQKAHSFWTQSKIVSHQSKRNFEREVESHDFNGPYHGLVHTLSYYRAKFENTLHPSDENQEKNQSTDKSESNTNHTKQNNNKAKDDVNEHSEDNSSDENRVFSTMDKLRNAWYSFSDRNGIPSEILQDENKKD